MTAPAADPDVRLALASALLATRFDSAAAAVHDATALIDDRADDEAAAVSLRARALARRSMGDLVGALTDLYRAVSVGERAGAPRRVGEARMSLVVALADAGRTDEALVEAVRAAELVSGADRSRLQAQRGLVLQRIGRYDEALACYRAALPGLRRAGDLEWVTRLLGNRGPMRAYLGDHRGAVADLHQCDAIAIEQGWRSTQARAKQNLGFAMSLVGDVPAALALLDEADQIWLDLGLDRSSLLVDRAEALLGAGLGAEAVANAGAALSDLERNGVAYDAAEARLLLARGELVAGRPAAARHAAELAATEFARQRRDTWTRLARQVAVHARWATGERGAALTRAARRAAEDCAAAGWALASIECRFVAARSALHAGPSPLALRLLGEVAAHRVAGGRRIGAQGLATAWHAEALLRLCGRDQVGAQRALRRGLAVLADNAAVLGATDLRAHAAVFGDELARLGTHLALETGRAADVLAWAERSRAGTLRSRPARPPHDDRLAATLARLRGVAARIRDETLAGRDVRALSAERDRIEDSVRGLARHARAEKELTRPVDLTQLVAELGPRVLIELVRDDDRLHAVTVRAGRTRLHELGSYADAVRELEALRFALSRLATLTDADVTSRVVAMALRGRDVAAERLDRLLLGPLSAAVGESPLVVVPTGDLHAMPWSVLPTLHGRAVSVAPSAVLWQRAQRRTAARADAPVTLACGPGLDHAEPEIAALRRHYPLARTLTGATATADAVREAMDGARLVHVAAHGVFRAENPQFSSLEMADGPLTVYDLERLERAPETLVLSACDSGLSDVRPGDELMGLAAAMTALGTRTLVASVVPVADRRSRDFMEELHDRLIAGERPATAVAATTASTGVDGFVCLGAG